MQVRVFPEYPLGIACGGIELRCLKTVSALNKYMKDEISVKLLDYYNADDEFDILHIFGSPPSMYEICFHARKTKKIIITAVSGSTNFSFLKTFIRNRLSNLAGMLHQHTDYARLQFIFQSASHVICCNDLERNFFCNTYNIPMEKLSIIPNGVAAYFYSSTEDIFRRKYGISNFVLFTGNITKRKNPLCLAQVLTKMNQKGVFIGSILSSEIEYASQFEKVISNSPDLLWIKGLSYDDTILASAYAASSILCLPSSAEVLPSSALEAMVSSTPVILSDLPYAYQPPFEKVSRCNPSEPSSIENCIQMIQNNPEKFTHPLPVDYSWDRIAQKIAAVYQKTSMSNVKQSGSYGRCWNKIAER